MKQEAKELIRAIEQNADHGIVHGIYCAVVRVEDIQKQIEQLKKAVSHDLTKND